MPRFFTQKPQDGKIAISGHDAAHLSRVLRLKEGDKVIACDGCGNDYVCTVLRIDEEVLLEVISTHRSEGNRSIDVTLFMCIPKADKMDMICQKCTELGVSEIVPVISKRCVRRPCADNILKKTQRWQRICFEASKQSGRDRVPAVSDLMSFEEAILCADKYDVSIFCYENEQRGRLRSVLDGCDYKRVCVMVGSEGGFEWGEYCDAVEAGFVAVSLGSLILRCETAPIVALSAIMFHSGNI